MAYQGNKTEAIYHSRLVKESPVKITIKKGPCESKNPKYPPFFVITYDGADYFYSVAKPQISAKLAPFLGQTIVLQFIGDDRDGSADVVVTGMEKPSAPVQDPEDQQMPWDQPQQPSEPPAGYNAALAGHATTQQTADAKPEVKREFVKLANQWSLAYKAAMKAFQNTVSPELQNDELFRSLLTSITVKASQAGLYTQLPGDRFI